MHKRKVLVINLNRNSGSLGDIINSRDFNNEDNEVTILDLCGSMKKEDFRSYEIEDLRKLDEDNANEKRAIEELFRFGSALSAHRFKSGKTVRRIRIEEFPLFWITNLAFRHYYFSWSESFFFLFQFIKNNKEYFKKYDSLNIVFQDNLSYLRGTVKGQIRKLGLNVKCIFPNNGKFPSTLIVIRMLLKLGHDIFSLRGYNGISKDNGNFVHRNLIITNFPGTWDEINHRDKVIGGISNFIQEGEGYQNIPLFVSLKDFKLWKVSKSDNEYFKILFSWRNYISFSAKVFRLLFRIAISRYNDITINGYYLEGSVIKEEMYKAVCNNIFHIYQASVLRKWINLNKGDVNVFYQDELYISGRLLSFFLRESSSKVRSFGCQHGVISAYDLVYKVSDIEIEPVEEANDGIPLPDYFIVWGEYFKKTILNNNSIANERVISSGNLNSNQSIRMQGQNQEGHLNSKCVKMLWCANMIEYSIKDYSIMRWFLINSETYTLKIRLHPSFDIRSEIESMLKEDGVKGRVEILGNTKLSDDISEADIVITNDISSIFLNAILEGKYVVRIISHMFVSDSLGLEDNIDLLYDVKSSDEFVNAIENIMRQDKFDFLIDLNELYNKSEVSLRKRIAE